MSRTCRWTHFHAKAALIIEVQGNKLDGKYAIVTGGSSRTGQGIVEYFAKHGAKVLNGDLQEPKSHPDGTFYRRTDASDWDDLLALFKKAVELFGHVDIVIPNAEIIDTDFKHVDDDGEPVKPDLLL